MLEDAPPCILSHSFSDAEFRALMSWLSSDEQANHVICAYSDTRTTEEGIEDFARVSYTGFSYVGQGWHRHTTI